MLRIVAGAFGGRRIDAPRGRHTRPTAEKVRAALYNALAQRLDLNGARAVDLYAGSGALGIEALSRGAAHVTFVEDNARTAALIRENLRTLEIPAGRAHVVPQKVLPWLRKAPDRPPVHLALLDPPYAAGEYEDALAALAGWPGLAANALIAVEAPAGLALRVPGGLEVLRAKRYGDTQLIFLGRVPAVPEAAGHSSSSP